MAELYGDNDCAPLRELLQNSADAIEARRIIQKRADWGCITLRIGKDALGAWIEIEDDGVGMSPETLTGTFLDFGKSFWSSTESIIEFPELAATDFRSIGTFGIGFFSVFMWGDSVQVTSRRFDASKRDTHVLTFNRGIEERPILREADPDEHLADGGTRVRIWLQGIEDATSSWMRLPESLAYSAPSEKMSPQVFVKWLCPLLGIEIFEERGNLRLPLLSKADWLTLKASQFLGWSVHPRYPKRKLKAIRHVRPMHNAQGNVIGRGSLSPETSLGWVIVGGMRAKSLGDFVGMFVGEPRKASREESWVNVPENELKRWADQQARLIAQNFSPLEQMECSRAIEELGGSTRNLYICRTSDRECLFKRSDLVEWARDKVEIRLIDMWDFDKLEANLGLENLKNDVLFEPISSSTTDMFFDISPSKLAQQFDPDFVAKYEQLGFDLLPLSRRIGRPVLNAIASAWNCTIEELFISQQIEENVSSGEVYVVDGVDLVLRKAPALAPSRKLAK